MSDLSHTRAGTRADTRDDMADHPDLPEMRERYNRTLGGRDVALVDALVFLLGLYCAVSPWVLHFTSSQPALVQHNLIIGIALAVLGLGITASPSRMYGLSWAICAMGAWMIVAPWVVGSGPDLGVILNNVIIGGLAVVLGLICAAASMKSGGSKSGGSRGGRASMKGAGAPGSRG
ncbi:SPW repeat protein [Streptomyces sp. NBC_00102]|uniref:SPW repeat protein n=1 Tax=Streptomyces sp. NBC_00102 TaxID=2975652 RepID=UPI00224E02A3|nr:SPW repeat protein [Streptomyces sp. NBC_00102]MCX5396011.1 SPW repeat protein [Streptomyces sp. NBC_00102]